MSIHVIEVDMEAVRAAHRPEINIVGGELPRIVEETEAALLRQNGGRAIYQHAGRLVEVVRSPIKQKGIRRPEGAPVLHPLDATAIALRATEAARFLKFDARRKDHVEIDCPRKVAEALLSRGRHEAPVLLGIVEAPYVRLDGTSVLEAGYDPETGLLLSTDMALDPLPEAPTQHDAADALECLYEPLVGFPFVTDEDQSAACAMMITILVRRVLGAAPMFLVTAPTPGTGKSLLLDAAAVLATGRTAAVMSVGDDQVETDKRLASVYLTGDQVVALDNIEHPLRSDLLCQALTQGSLRIRPLGVSTVLAVPTNAAVLATGNNARVRGDLVRRTAWIRLDAGIERPETRVFAFDVLERVAQARAALVRAALIVIRAYAVAGWPDVPVPPLGGFADFDRMVRRPLIWAGMKDPLGATDQLRDADPELSAAAGVLAIWSAVYREPVTISRVVADATGNPPHQAIAEALAMALGDKITAARFAGWCRRFEGRPVHGMRLVKGEPDRHQKLTTWRVLHSAAGDAWHAGVVSQLRGEVSGQ